MTKKYAWCDEAYIYSSKYLQCFKIGAWKLISLKTTRRNIKIISVWLHHFACVYSFELLNIDFSHLPWNVVKEPLPIYLFFFFFFPFQFSIFISRSGYKAKAKIIHSRKDHVCIVIIRCVRVCVCLCKRGLLNGKHHV